MWSFSKLCPAKFAGLKMKEKQEERFYFPLADKKQTAVKWQQGAGGTRSRGNEEPGERGAGGTRSRGNEEPGERGAGGTRSNTLL